MHDWRRAALLWPSIRLHCQRSSTLEKNAHRPASEYSIAASPTDKCCPRKNDAARKLGHVVHWTQMLTAITNCTNIKIRQAQGGCWRPQDAAETNLIEIKALLGILYVCGIYGSSHANFKDFYRRDGTGMPFFQMVMRETRMHFLLRMLRFDDITTRNESRQTDYLAPIRQIFTQFVENCKTVYSLGDTFTIDEMLVGFRGQCPFRQYIPSKPAKYGIKIYSIVDSRT